MTARSAEGSSTDAAIDPHAPAHGGAPARLDRSVIYEYLCQLSELRDARLLPEEQFQARRAELLKQI
ncbi:MAG: hypothetical protein ABR529_14605 [Actinomycetota bacterium]